MQETAKHLFYVLLLITLCAASVAQGNSFTARIPAAIAAGEFKEAEFLIQEAIKIGVISAVVAEQYRAQMRAQEQAHQAQDQSTAVQEDKKQQSVGSDSKPEADTQLLPERTEHGEQRAAEARSGDTHRQVGDANRVVEEGRRFQDTKTGNIVHVKGGKVVITNSKGQIVSQFKNTKANTQARISEGRWVPINE